MCWLEGKSDERERASVFCGDSIANIVLWWILDVTIIVYFLGGLGVWFGFIGLCLE